MKHTRCKGCGTKICVNNNDERRVVAPASLKRLGVVLCWRCERYEPMFKFVLKEAKKGNEKAQKILEKMPFGKPLGEV